MKEKLVIFDFADTIAELSPHKELLLQEYIFRECGMKIQEKNISDAYHYLTNLFFYSSVSIFDQNNKKKFYDSFNKELIIALGLSHLVNTNNMFDFFCNNRQHWKLKNTFNEMLDELISKGYIVSLVSNFDIALYDILENMKLLNRFDSVFISQEVGLEKPNVDFLQLPLLAHNISPELVYYIGDSYSLDYIPGIKLGVNSFLLDEKGYYPSLKNRVGSLEEFNEILLKDLKNDQ